MESGSSRTQAGGGYRGLERSISYADSNKEASLTKSWILPPQLPLQIEDHYNANAIVKIIYRIALSCRPRPNKLDEQYVEISLHSEHSSGRTAIKKPVIILIPI